MRAFGPRPAFLYAWSRLAVIQSGSIALLAFIFGDYATALYSLGHYSNAIYAGLVVLAVTLLNCAGIYFGTRAQNWLTNAEVLGLLVLIVDGDRKDVVKDKGGAVRLDFCGLRIIKKKKIR